MSNNKYNSYNQSPRAIHFYNYTEGRLLSIVHSIAINNWTIHPYYAGCFSRYFILKWRADFFLGQNVDGIITKDEVDYIVIYYKTSRGKLIAELQNNPRKEITLSFREPIPEAGLPAYVLVN